MNKNRRNLLKGAAAMVAVSATATSAEASPKREKKVYNTGPTSGKTPLYSEAVSYGELLFLSGQGAHFSGDITAHTKFVFDEIEKLLKDAGSSMEKVLKVNVYLNDISDFDAMNAVYQGKFGTQPPARTTVSPAGGLPGKGLIEIDVIAYI